MGHLVFSYGDKASVQIEDLVTEDFLKRLSFAACHRWGLVIELLIEALSLSAFSADKVCQIDHFSAAFSQKSGFPLGYSPFTMSNYEDIFDQEKMRQMYEKTRMRKSPGANKTPDRQPGLQRKDKGLASWGPVLLLGLPCLRTLMLPGVHVIDPT